MMDHVGMWKELGVDLERHDEMLAASTRLFERTHLWQRNRPRTMAWFDEAFHQSHGSRVAEVVEHRRHGGKSIGTFCIYVPEELALAAGVVPIPLCGGTNWSVSFADKMFPRDICPIIRSTFGLALSATCPFKTLKDFAVGETTCDAKKKAWDLMGFQVMEVPQKKAELDRALWRAEVQRFRTMMEELSGAAISRDALAEAIALCNERRRLLREINQFRALDEPPLSGIDALLVSQIALSQDVRRFNAGAAELLEELRHRAIHGVSGYAGPGERVVLAGSPSPLGHAKLHFVAETSGLRVVADESCTGSRYFRQDVTPATGDIEELVEAVADRYFRLDCACFSPNSERRDNLLTLVRDVRARGVVHGILQFCHTFDIEAKLLDRVLSKAGIPSIKLVSDYSSEDLEQLRVRLESFREMLRS